MFTPYELKVIARVLRAAIRDGEGGPLTLMSPKKDSDGELCFPVDIRAVKAAEKALAKISA